MKLDISGKRNYLYKFQGRWFCRAGRNMEYTKTLEFDQPQRAPTPGQAVVLYDGDTVLGGSTIL